MSQLNLIASGPPQDRRSVPPKPGRRETYPHPSQVAPLGPTERERAIIVRLLTAEPLCRLVTLVGPQGAGKTRLAWQVGLSVLDAFSDGVHMIPLASTQRPDQLITTLTDALALPRRGQGASKARLYHHLRARHALLMLDGFERLLEGAHLIDDVLRHAPRVKLLITSRARLNLHAEWVRQVERASPLVIEAPRWGTAVAPLGLGGARGNHAA